MLIICVCAIAAACVRTSEIPERGVSVVPLTTAAQTESVEATYAPLFTSAPEASPTPADEPAPEGPYKSDKYPVTESSRRTQAGGMYPEEQRLNYDANKFKCIIDLTNQAVFIYERDENGEYTVLVREMIASCGTTATPTPVGTFQMKDDYKRFGYFVRFGCYAQYWSLIVNRIYFHSIPYVERDSRTLDVEGFYQLGSPASHGCIRLLPDDAHWVYLYLCPGTTVTITNSLPYDEALRARLMRIELPVPQAYQIGQG